MVGGPTDVCRTTRAFLVRSTTVTVVWRTKQPAEVTAPAAQRVGVACHRRDVVPRDELEVRDARLASRYMNNSDARLVRQRVEQLVDDGADLGPRRDRVGRTAHEHRRLVERREQQVTEGLDRAGASRARSA